MKAGGKKGGGGLPWRSQELQLYIRTQASICLAASWGVE